LFSKLENGQILGLGFEHDVELRKAGLLAGLDKPAPKPGVDVVGMGSEA
jgi:hypothetical protein